MNPGRNRAWLSVDLTMPQLKSLICVVENDGATSGQIAKRLGVGLSTVTGIVDRLGEQELITRREDPDDRRITRVLPTPRARTMVDELLRYRNEVITEILSRLDAQQLQIIETAFDYLRDAIDQMAAHQPEEVVA
jgi:DNA-binding MarR family transcriptional regulator